MDAPRVYVRAWALGFFFSHISTHTPNIALRHLPPDSARFSYATEGALLIAAQLSTDGQRPPNGSGTNMTVEAA